MVLIFVCHCVGHRLDPLGRKSSQSNRLDIALIPQEQLNQLLHGYKIKCLHEIKRSQSVYLNKKKKRQQKKLYSICYRSKILNDPHLIISGSSLKILMSFPKVLRSFLKIPSFFFKVLRFLKISGYFSRIYEILTSRF